jgi:carbonic anhydrase/acetyltransferase-like protein (isoleucine patch superfamily)
MPFDGVSSRIHPTAYLAPTAVVVGDVEIGEECSVWFHAVVRGDVHRIRIGRRTNIQDLVTVHCTWRTGPTAIGDDVTVGHGAVLHACTIHDRTLVGMGAVVLDGAEVGPDAIVGAGAVVPPGMRVPPGTLAVGVPARVLRELSDDDRTRIRETGLRYLEYTTPRYR